MQSECKKANRSRECDETLAETYTIASSWKCSDWFPMKILTCCIALTLACFIVLFGLASDDLFGGGFSGGTSGLGYVLMYLPVLGLATVGFILNGIVFLVRRRKCEKNLVVLNLIISIVPLIPALLILLQIIQELLGFG